MYFGQYSLMELVSVGVGTFPSEEGRNSIIFYWVFTGGFKDGLSESVIALSTLYSIYCTEQWTGCTLYWSQCTLYTYPHTVHNTVYSAQFTISCASLHVHCTLYTVQVYIVHTPVKLQLFSQFAKTKLSNVPLLPSSTLCDAQWKIQKHTNFEYSRLVWKWATIWHDTIPKQTLYKYLFCFSLYSKGF